VCEQVQQETDFEPSVSIVVPVLNGEATIRVLLESLLNIHYPKGKVEITIVDGISTDGTRDIIAKYPLKIVVEEKNGPNAARNSGIEHTSGEIIAFTDSDCVVPREWIDKTVDNFRDPKVGCVGGDVKGLNDDFLSQYARESIFPVIRRCKTRKELNAPGPLRGCPVGCNMSFRREALKRAGGFDEAIQYGFEEDELIERVCKAGYQLVLDPQVSVWHKHRATLTGLLKQSFKYGRGAGRLTMRSKHQDVVRRWFLINLGFTLQAIMTLGFVAYLASVAAWFTLFDLFLALVFIPFSVLATTYALRACRNRKFRNILLYTVVDLLRIPAFLSGEICSFFRRG
jgi:glycosyltransferase involved in cell wall biosynthesis